MFYIIPVFGIFGYAILAIRLLYVPLLVWAIVNILAYSVGGTHWHIPIVQSRGNYTYSVKKDPSFIYRSFKYSFNNEEYVIGGFPEQTVGDVLRGNWPFKKIKKNDDWMVKDDRGNVVTEQLFSKYDGIIFVELSEPLYLERAEVGIDESSKEEYSDMTIGVEFYD